MEIFSILVIFIILFFIPFSGSYRKMLELIRLEKNVKVKETGGWFEFTTDHRLISIVSKHKLDFSFLCLYLVCSIYGWVEIVGNYSHAALIGTMFVTLSLGVYLGSALGYKTAIVDPLQLKITGFKVIYRKAKYSDLLDSFFFFIMLNFISNILFTCGVFILVIFTIILKGNI